MFSKRTQDGNKNYNHLIEYLENYSPEIKDSINEVLYIQIIFFSSIMYFLKKNDNSDHDSNSSVIMIESDESSSESQVLEGFSIDHKAKKRKIDDTSEQYSNDLQQKSSGSTEEVFEDTSQTGQKMNALF